MKSLGSPKFEELLMLWFYSCGQSMQTQRKTRFAYSLLSFAVMLHFLHLDTFTAMHAVHFTPHTEICLFNFVWLYVDWFGPDSINSMFIREVRIMGKSIRSSFQWTKTKITTRIISCTFYFPPFLASFSKLVHSLQTRSRAWIYTRVEKVSWPT